VSEGVSDGVNTYFQFLCLHFFSYLFTGGGWNAMVQARSAVSQ
jgi:hypothetical protein